MNRGLTSIGAISATVIGLAGSTASASVITMRDGNSLAVVDTNSIGGNQPGMRRWEVDGVNHLYCQWFWYRIGNNAEQRINALPIIGEFLTDTNGNGLGDTLTIRYGNNQLQIDIVFGLQGGSANSNRADISEQIRITNLTNSTLPISFFQYSDFDLGGTVNDDFVGILGPNVVQQSDFSSGLHISETVVTPPANNWEVSVFPTTINKLDDALSDNLNGVGGPLVGAADYTWAFQWNVNIPARRNFLISKDKQITPAPGAIALLGLGGLAVGRRRR